MAYDLGGIDFDVFEILDSGYVQITFTRANAALLASRSLTLSATSFNVETKLSTEKTEWIFTFPPEGVHYLRVNTEQTTPNR